MKKLPLGSQTFSDFKEENYIYVDKTKEIYKMINSGKKFFLSRPRRFGKSLLVSTLEELLKDLKIYLKDFTSMTNGTGINHIPSSKLIWEN